mmetsp:Transcript_15915/g.14396  ORF Transcript_15915/g.14396 Transcript_15915/m.14396 type:complete len:93 (-) Transcript_15915:2219-2497(-)
MKPSAQRAQPEYELSNVITTGISAPPIDDVMCRPSAPLDTTPVPKQTAASVGSPVVTNPIKLRTLALARPMLIVSLPGRVNALLDNEPASLP